MNTPIRLSELRTRLIKAGAEPDKGSFLILDGRHVCQWVDIWLGQFSVPALAPTAMFSVDEFGDRLVVELL